MPEVGNGDLTAASNTAGLSRSDMSTGLLSVLFLVEAFEADEPLDLPLLRGERRDFPDILVGYKRVYFTSRIIRFKYDCAKCDISVYFSTTRIDV